MNTGLPEIGAAKPGDAWFVGSHPTFMAQVIVECDVGDGIREVHVF